MWCAKDGKEIADFLGSLRRKVSKKVNFLEKIRALEEGEDTAAYVAARDRIREFVDEAAKHLLFGLAKRSDSPIIYAVNIRGEEVALATNSILPSTFLKGNPEKAKAFDRYAVEGSFGPEYYLSESWPTMVIEGQLTFENRSRNQLDRPDIDSIDLNTSVITLAKARALSTMMHHLMEVKKLDAEMQIGGFVVPSRFVRGLPDLLARIKSIEPLEGWKVVVKCSLDQSSWLSDRTAPAAKVRESSVQDTIIQMSRADPCLSRKDIQEAFPELSARKFEFYWKMAAVVDPNLARPGPKKRKS